jgi:hypothetical protein
MGHERLGDGIDLRQKPEDALQVEIGELPITAPLQRSGVAMAGVAAAV